MSWAAVDKINDAVDETKDLLLPFDLGTWLRLAVVVTFTGSGLSFPNLPTTGGDFTESKGFQSSSATPDMGASAASTQIPQGLDPATALSTGSFVPGTFAGLFLIGAAVFSIVLLFIGLSSIMEFVFYRVLENKEVRIRKNFKRHLGSGLRYAVFRIGVGILTLALLGGAVGLVIIQPIAAILGVLVAIPVVLALVIFLGLINNFAVPHAMINGGGVVGAWREIYGDLKAQWRQVGVYILIRFLIRMVTGIISLMLILVMLIPLLIVFGIPAFLVGSNSILLGLVVGLGILVFLALALAIQIPIQVFMYDHARLVYHELVE